MTRTDRCGLPPSIEERRTQVQELLKRCCDEKLLRGGTKGARQLAEEAMHHATEPDWLPSPWPELASYRLAHLLLRSPDRGSNLAAIDEHLRRAGGITDASKISPLGARPHIYRLAVLQLMMGEARGVVQRNGIQKQISEEFKAACATIDTPSVLDSRDSLRIEKGPLQHEAFNLLELASYFLNQNYDQLPGRGFRDELAGVFDGGWFLVGPDPEISSVRMSKKFAYAELASRAAACPNALLIHLPKFPDEPSWRLASEREWRANVNRDWIVLLATQRKTPSIGLDELRRKVIGNDDSQEGRARYRQLKSRASKAIEELMGCKDLGISDGSDKLAPGVTILGVVHDATLAQRPTNRR